MTGDRRVLDAASPGEAAWLAFWLVVVLGLASTALPAQPELWQWGIITGQEKYHIPPRPSQVPICKVRAMFPT